MLNADNNNNRFLSNTVLFSGNINIIIIIVPTIIYIFFKLLSNSKVEIEKTVPNNKTLYKLTTSLFFDTIENTKIGKNKTAIFNNENTIYLIDFRLLRFIPKIITKGISKDKEVY